MLKVVKNSEDIKDENGFISDSEGWVVVDENNVRQSSKIHARFYTAETEQRILESKKSKLGQILEEYDLDEMLTTMNRVCAGGQNLTLNEKQSIRFMIEELNKAMKGF